MFKNKDIICISTIDWDFLRQRHQIFMEMFARQGNRVFYLENLNPTPVMDLSIFSKIINRIAKIFMNFSKSKGVKKPIPNLRVITPFVIPFKNRIARFINDEILIKGLLLYFKLRGVKNPVIWTYMATSTALKLINNLKPEVLIYDCVFDAVLHPFSPKDIEITQRKIIELSNLIFTDNHYLFQKCKEINLNTHMLLPCVDLQRFNLSDKAKSADLLEDIKRPRLCFFGGIDNIRLDLELIEYVAKKRPDWSIVLFGPIVKSDISNLKFKNIFFKGTVEYNKLPSYLKEMDVLILPYKIIPFSKSIFPAKIFECLASEKPIVSTPLEELSFFENGLIKIAKTKEEFVSTIEDVLVSDTEEARKRRLKAAKENSWDDRFGRVQTIIEEALIKREL